MIILVDFDGTIIPQLPYNGICDIDTGAERVLKRLVSSGHLLVLWTCRNNSRENPYNYVNGIYRGEGDKHLDELYKMMILKLKDIHQKVCVEGNDWYDQRSELCNHFSCF